MKPSRAAAAFFTLAAIVAVAETIFTGLYLPWPELTITFGTAAGLLACLAAGEWTALHNRRRPQRTPDVDPPTPTTPRTSPIRPGTA